MTKPIAGYGELFRMLSYQQIGPAAMLSRAVGGLIDRTVVLTMPGSPAAVRSGDGANHRARAAASGARSPPLASRRRKRASYRLTR